MTVFFFYIVLIYFNMILRRIFMQFITLRHGHVQVLWILLIADLAI